MKISTGFIPISVNSDSCFLGTFLANGCKLVFLNQLRIYWKLWIVFLKNERLWVCMYVCISVHSCALTWRSGSFM